MITDLDSDNGTYVNGKLVQPTCSLHPGDTVRIGPNHFVFNFDETLVQEDEAGNIRLDALHLTQRIGRSLLLRDISLSIFPREFVAIVGASGAGKSTLLKALCSLHPASQGTVLVNEHDLYKHFEAYRTDVGYVPQEDIIHRELTVTQALDYSARLRLPADLTASERQHRIEEVLGDLELEPRRDAQVHQLSGGERKRVSIGVELLTKPSLFFLDEATSGLDPSMETQMMLQLRQLADQGRTVALVTHATKNVKTCDRVLFLVKGGRLAFLGTPTEALTYFGVRNFDDIYLKLERERSPDAWQQSYRTSDYYQRHVLDRHKQLGRQATSGQRTRSPYPRPLSPQRVSAWRQWLIVTQRNWTILRQDRASVVLMGLIAPILGIMDFLIWRRDLFDVTIGDPTDAFTLFFVSVLIAMLVDSLAMMREFVKEADIFRREHMIGLRLRPYVFSKVGLGLVLALYQAAIILVTKLLAVDLPIDFNAGMGMFFTLFLVILTAMVMGLLVSALSPNQNVAALLTVLFIVPQITFSGVLVPFEADSVGHALSRFTMTHWGHEALVTLSDIGHDIAEDPCWQQRERLRQRLSEAQKAQCNCMGPSLFTQCNFPGIRKEYNPAVDQPEPSQPQKPAALPEVLDTVGPNLQGLLQTYNKQIEDYNHAMGAWQSDYSQWKKEREEAIATGETLIRRYLEAEGDGFAVNLWGHWLRLCLLMLGMLMMILGIQRYKYR